MSRYYKWPVQSGEAFAKVSEDYACQYIIGATETNVGSIDRSHPSVIEITESEWEKWAEKWRASFGS